MKNTLKYLIIIILFYGCDSEDAGNCLQTAGNSIQQEFTVSNFNKILINERVELIIKEGIDQKVVVETGENLLNDIDIQVINNELVVINNNTCNFVRDYGLTKVYVTSPNIVKIRNSSELAVRSDGTLTYPSLNLIADDFQSDYLNVGDFHISINNTTLRITSNGISNFYIDGQTTNLTVGFFAGDSRFEGKNLIAENVTIIHKSTNDMLVNPQVKIEGDIFSLGDVIAYNQPAIVDVTEHYQGKLIFE